ncbi:MAG TPA: lysoplasmalogenase [Steroidobacteraceae bacterium]
MLSIVVCALAVAGLLIAERRNLQAGVWAAKPLASAAFVWTAVASGALDSVYGRWILLGLVLCLVGDVLLIPRQRPAVFRVGVVAFLLGHVAYGAGFLTRPLDPWGLALGGLLLAVALFVTWRWLAPSLPPDMVASVRAYLLVIGTMATLATGVGAAGGPWLVAVGAFAFTASDVSVARDRFVRHEFVNRAWGLPLYYAAQLLLALSPS